MLTVPAAVALVRHPGAARLGPVRARRLHRRRHGGDGAGAGGLRRSACRPSCCRRCCNRSYFAREDTRTPFRYALVAMVVNAVVAIGLRPGHRLHRRRRSAPRSRAGRWSGCSLARHARQWARRPRSTTAAPARLCRIVLARDADGRRASGAAQLAAVGTAAGTAGRRTLPRRLLGLVAGRRWSATSGSRPRASARCPHGGNPARALPPSSADAAVSTHPRPAAGADHEGQQEPGDEARRLRRSSAGPPPNRRPKTSWIAQQQPRSA